MVSELISSILPAPATRHWMMNYFVRSNSGHKGVGSCASPFLLICGKADDGKSLLMDMVRCTMPKVCSVSCPGNALDNLKTAEAQYVKKTGDSAVRLVHFDEWSTGIKDSELIKKIANCDLSKNNAHLVITSNSMRRFSDEGKSLRRRLHYVTMHGTPNVELINTLGIQDPSNQLRTSIMHVMLQEASLNVEGATIPELATGDTLLLISDFVSRYEKTKPSLSCGVGVDVLYEEAETFFYPAQVDQKCITAAMQAAGYRYRAGVYN